MCEFCVQHGAGKKWYLAAQNYADELVRSQGRESFIKHIYKDYRKMYGRNVRLADIAVSLPFVKEYALMKFNDYFTNDHAGQVISLEDAISISSIPGRVSLADCPCSKYLFGKNEKKCMLFGATAEIVDNIPEFSPVKDIGAEEAAEFLKGLNASGMVHTIWTFKTPYIGVICNCNNRGCILLHLKNRYKSLNIIRKGHEIASVDLEICNGCGNCQRACQFGAVLITGKKAQINHKCHGCGVCRNFCSVGAIQLVPKIKF
jgi:ferredoxin